MSKELEENLPLLRTSVEWLRDSITTFQVQKQAEFHINKLREELTKNGLNYDSYTTSMEPVDKALEQVLMFVPLNVLEKVIEMKKNKVENK